MNAKENPMAEDIRNLLGPHTRSDFEELLKRIEEAGESLAPRAPGSHESAGQPACNCSCWRCTSKEHCVRCNWGHNLAHWEYPLATSREDDDD
jgi:hypothetical protein